MKQIDITPNPAKTIESLRYLTYSNETALADIVDNSIDADADVIDVKIAADKIVISDNGCGMTEDTLAEAIKLGSDTDKQDGQLGRFGMGLVTASISMARKLTVYSRYQGDNAAVSGVCLDLDTIKDTWSAENVDPTDSVELYMAENSMGTIVTLEKIDHFKYKSIDTLVAKTKRHFGEVFRNFIDAGVKIYINDELVESIDPLVRTKETTNVIVDEDVEYDGKVFHITAVETDSDGSNSDADNKANPANQGFYIVRNNRQIARAVMIGKLVRHPRYNRFRCEVSLSGDLDDQVGINFTKDKVEISQGLSDKIFEKARLCINICVNNCNKRKSADKENAEMDHSDAEHIIERKRSLLPRPTLWKELHRKKVEEEEKEEGNEEDDGKKKKKHYKRNHAKNVQPGYRGMHARFEQNNDTESSVLFSYENEGSDIVIRWNIRHPFYSKFVAPFNKDKSVSSPIDLWAFSIALAELQTAEDPEQSEKLQQLREEYSRILRTLLG